MQLIPPHRGESSAARRSQVYSEAERAGLGQAAWPESRLRRAVTKTLPFLCLNFSACQKTATENAYPIALRFR